MRIPLMALIAFSVSACGQAPEEEEVSAAQTGVLYRECPSFERRTECGVMIFRSDLEGLFAVKDGVLQKLTDGCHELSPGCFRVVVGNSFLARGWNPTPTNCGGR